MSIKRMQRTVRCAAPPLNRSVGQGLDSATSPDGGELAAVLDYSVPARGRDSASGHAA